MSGEKYKHCCLGVVPWSEIPEIDSEFLKHVSPRGRNIIFLDKIGEILQLDRLDQTNLQRAYKAAFTAKAVKEIHRAILEIWPPSIDIRHALRGQKRKVTALYVGDYSSDSMLSGVVRNSLYADKILLMDPFMYPFAINPKFDPLVNPDQHRQQTMRNVNFYASLQQGIESGLINFIHSPLDFHPRLKFEVLAAQRAKVENNPQLRKALDDSLNTPEMKARHERYSKEFFLLLPNSELKRIFNKVGGSEISEEQFLKYIEKERAKHPDLLEAVGPENPAQLASFSSGAGYEEAKIIANMTNSYITTDIKPRWMEVELDRNNLGDESSNWSAFSKAFDSAPLKVLNNVELQHALKLRKEQRLESMRAFLRRVWLDAADTDHLFSEKNAISLASELRDEIDKAQIEWDQIGSDLTKMVAGGATSGLLAGGMIASGQGAFLAAAAVVASAGALAIGANSMLNFPKKHPAAFFLKLDKE